MEAMVGQSLVLNMPATFEDPVFLAWLNDGKAKFTWHIKGNSVADEYSDVVVCVDPSLNGEGSDSDMPEYIWNSIIEECRKHFKPKAGVPHILVRLTNLQE